MKEIVYAALLSKEPNGRMVVKRILENPIAPKNKDGTAHYGPYLRRLLSVKQISMLHSVSKNKAQKLRCEQPLLCLADFPGQEPLAESLRLAAAPVPAVAA